MTFGAFAAVSLSQDRSSIGTTTPWTALPGVQSSVDSVVSVLRLGRARRQRHGRGVCTLRAGPIRKLTGILELLGSLGLILGYFVPQFTVAAAGGLTLMMGVGVVVRLRCGDSLADALPAIVILLINLYIVVYALGVGMIPAR
ncbi:MAG: DoxX family protein [Mycobacterium sp.]